MWVCNMYSTSWVSWNRNQSVVRTLSERASRRRRIYIHNRDDSRMEAERTLDPKNEIIISCFFFSIFNFVCVFLDIAGCILVFSGGFV
jgi:hypothetical protein